MFIQEKRISNDVLAKQGAHLNKVNAVADELIQSCGRPQHETAMSSPSPQLTYDSSHLTITLALNSSILSATFVDAETDNQISRETAVRTMPCLAQWLSKQNLVQASAPR